ncbi:unnamed protein product, partial [Closterium sp. NIES-53]
SPEAYLRLGLQLQSIGDHRDAIKYAHKGLKLKPMDIELNYLEASSLHAVGDYNAAIKQYSVILTLPSQAASEYAQVQQSLAFYQRDIATYTWSKLARPFIDFQIDQDLDTNFKRILEVHQSCFSAAVFDVPVLHSGPLALSPFLFFVLPPWSTSLLFPPPSHPPTLRFLNSPSRSTFTGSLDPPATTHSAAPLIPPPRPPSRRQEQRQIPWPS